MSVLFLSLCFVLFLLSIACRALHEYIRHDLERLCTRKSRSEYFDLIIDQYEAVRRGFEMLRSILLFSIPALAFAEISAAEEFRNPESVSEFFSMGFPTVRRSLRYANCLLFLSFFQINLIFCASA